MVHRHCPENQAPPSMEMNTNKLSRVTLPCASAKSAPLHSRLFPPLPPNHSRLGSFAALPCTVRAPDRMPIVHKDLASREALQATEGKLGPLSSSSSSDPRRLKAVSLHLETAK